MLELKNVCFDVKTDKGEKVIVSDVNLTIGDNKFVVITGPNGGGKSTLAKIIMGIEKVTSGQILFDGIDITNMSIVIPPNEIVGKYAGLARSFIAQIDKNQQESRRLAQLRDTLLPRLMSGEIDINEIKVG